MKTLYQMNPASVPEIFVVAAQTECLKDFVAEWSKAMASYQVQEEQHADPSVRQWLSLGLSWLNKIMNV